MNSEQEVPPMILILVLKSFCHTPLSLGQYNHTWSSALRYCKNSKIMDVNGLCRPICHRLWLPSWLCGFVILAVFSSSGMLFYLSCSFLLQFKKTISKRCFRSIFLLRPSGNIVSWKLSSSIANRIVRIAKNTSTWRSNPMIPILFVNFFWG